MTNSLRTFIAVELSTQQIAIIKDTQRDLKSIDADVKWVAPENCHITLKFLGQTPQDKLPSIKEIMDEKAKAVVKFSIELDGAGAFPSLERPDIIWIGTKRNPSLANLSDSLQESLATLGFQKESRDFHPHITIGRIRSNLNIKALSDKLKSISFHCDPQKIQHITLFESLLSSDGPRYSALHRSSLKT